MNLEAVGDFGIIGVAVVLILREVFSYLKHRDVLSLPTGDGECEDAVTRLTKIDEQLSLLATSSQRMCTVLEQTDSRGLPLVYRDGTLTEAIASLGRSIEKLEGRL